MSSQPPVGPWREQEIVVESLQQFHDTVGRVGRVQPFSQGVPRTSDWIPSQYMWRGADDASWGLHSSLSRTFYRYYARWASEKELRQLDNRILQEALRWQLDWQALGGRLSALELLARLQHHGVPTRLIDVTEQPLVALWFAVQNVAASSRDGLVYAFDVSRWSIRSRELDLPWAASAEDWGDQLHAWKPPPLDDRIVRQAGNFLLGGVPRDEVQRKKTSVNFTPGDLPRIESTAVRRGQPPTGFVVRVLAETKQSIRRDLALHHGISVRTMFPDPEGFLIAGVDAASAGVTSAGPDKLGRGTTFAQLDPAKPVPLDVRYLWGDFEYGQDDEWRILQRHLHEDDLWHAVLVVRVDDGYIIRARPGTTLAPEQARVLRDLSGAGVLTVLETS